MRVYYDDPVTLLSAVAVTGSSQWIQVSDYSDFIIDVRLSSTGTVKVMLSNELTQPTNTNDGPQQGSDITGTGMTTITDVPARWLKLKTTALGGTISAYFMGKTLNLSKF